MRESEGAQAEQQPTLLQIVLAKREDPYEGADIRLARRIAAMIWILGTVVAVLLLPFSPVGGHISALGWGAVAVMAAAAVATCRWLVDQERSVSFNQLLALSYGSLAMLVFAQWITGGATSPLRELYLLTLLGAAGVHPPRRSLVFLLVLGAGMAAPLAYDGWSSTTAVDMLGRMLLWYALSFVVIALIAYVRYQRVVAERQQKDAHALARVDALTGLGNRRAFEEALQAEVARENRAGSAATLLLLDVNRFKEINDNHGHRAGDRCLRELASAISTTLRPADRCYRWGGDEFVVLLPDTDLDAAEQAAERLSAAIRETCLRPNGEPLTAALGVAEVTDAAEADALIDAADLALFRQKRLALG